MPYQTKYELMAELRELNRGFPRMAISNLKKHELEARIDALKKFRAHEEASLKHVQPAKTGPLGPRPISKVVLSEDGELIVPEPPKPRISDYSIQKARKAAKAELEGLVRMPTVVKKLGRPPKAKVPEMPEEEDSVNSNPQFLQNTISYKNFLQSPPNLQVSSNKLNKSVNSDAVVANKLTKSVKKPAKNVKIDPSVNPELVRIKSKPVVYNPYEQEEEEE